MTIGFHVAFFLGCTCSMWRFLGQGSNLRHSSDPSCCSGNAGSLTLCATREFLGCLRIFELVFVSACVLSEGFSHCSGVVRPREPLRRLFVAAPERRGQAMPGATRGGAPRPAGRLQAGRGNTWAGAFPVVSAGGTRGRRAGSRLASVHDLGGPRGAMGGLALVSRAGGGRP